MARPEVTGRKYIGKRGVAERYDVTTRTITRWIEAGVLPPPDLRIRDRGYWDEAGLDRHDRASVVAQGSDTARLELRVYANGQGIRVIARRSALCGASEAERTAAHLGIVAGRGGRSDEPFADDADLRLAASLLAFHP